MTNVEAIAELRNMQKFNYTLAPGEVFDMAISALEKQEGEGGLTMAEYISRDWLLTHTHTGIDTIQMMQTMIDAPAADVEEVRHGRWIKHNDRSCWYCSECNTDNYYAYTWDCDTGGFKFQDNYCPNCGAKMDGERKGGDE